MAPRAVTLPRDVCDALGLTAEESAFREGSATIVLPSKEAAFLNPVQEFNRDLSTLAIRTWSDLRNDEKKQKFLRSREKKGASAKRRGGQKREGQAKRQKLTTERGEVRDETAIEAVDDVENEDTAVDHTQGYRSYKFTLLEALSATGLRSIRYAREIPSIKSVLANDLSSTAVDAMKRNLALNFPANKPIEEWIPGKEEEQANLPSAGKDEVLTELDDNASASTSSLALPEAKLPTSNGISNGTSNGSSKLQIHPDCKVIVNEGDAMSLMYAHREEKKRFDVIDLDPYGSAAMFLDGAVQAVAEGGLLCITCTDSAVLAGNGYPEKCFSAYGGVGTRVEYCHEVALRLLLHAISASSARYGRYMEPMLSLSIDFYIRVFVRIYTRPIEVKKLASQIGAVLTCNSCQNASELRFGRHTQQLGRDGKPMDKYQGGAGPSVGNRCEECYGNYLLAGPMWLGRLHNQDFCHQMLTLVNSEETGSSKRFKTIDRINGMVGMAAEELPDVPFYLTPSKISSFFHCNNPPLLTIVSALLHAGHQVSRSHCAAGSIKTNASRKEIYDLWRNWIAIKPVKMESISPTSPAMTLLSRPIEKHFNLTDEHPEAKKIVEGSGKGTRYQMNPLPNWGPGTAAKSTPRSNQKAHTPSVKPVESAENSLEIPAS